MNMRIRIIALACAAVLALVGCQAGPAAQPTQKEGVVYLDPNGARNEASRGTEQGAPASDGDKSAPAAADPVEPAQSLPQASEPGEATAPLELYFEYRGVRIEPMMTASSVLTALGEPIRRFEADSCAYVGKDVFCVYPGMQLTVNEVEGVERITLIQVTDDTVTIPQGLRIYDEEDKLLATMGGTDENGFYTYESGQIQLIIQVREAEDGARRIANMEYRVAEDL